MAGGRRHGVTLKKLKRALKKAGLKTTGKKSTLTKRVKKAHLRMKGGQSNTDTAPEVKEEITEVAVPGSTGSEEGGRRSRRGRKGRGGRKSRRSRGFKLF